MNWERHHWQKYHFWTKSYHVISVANSVVNPLISYMPLLHNMSLCYSQSNFKKIYGFYLTKKFQSSLPWRLRWNYAVVLCNDFTGNLLVLFLTMSQSVKRPCDIIYFKISTAYDVWFSRYRLSKMKLATDSALVLVFINFLWAVYITSQSTM